ncbi:hypothetical protein ASG11_00500 [Sphingomonas sp. Leaf357]|uniref:hypothetical protein n=1 Tax=Sphingomonas sp. Leaf357 TaxID=1736350 RepID=UPI0006F7FEF0|nr:hypothetical protein [Sphingomonas sp. Leaf357]KQS02942.1 hypothetical protein ASG11_00500 [Sphingomonas sp. Leaf357]
MPFRHAHLYILALIALTVLAFWPTYFSILSTSPWGFHFHGITATLWLFLLALQSWTIHDRRFALHRSLGMASLAVFPLFLAGGAAVVSSMASATLNGELFYQTYGARLGIMDSSSVVLLGYLYHQALKHRRSVQLHARYLLATPLPLIMPIVGRVLNHLVPPLAIHGPQDFHLFAWGVRWASVVGIAITVWLYATAPRHGRPFLVAGAVIVAQQILFDSVGYTSAWQNAFLAFGRVPVIVVVLATLAVGAGLSWAGWIAGARPKRAAAALNSG